MDEPRQPLELTAVQLRKVTEPASLGFQTTADLPEPHLMAGQQIAQEAIDFALEITDSRYNLYVAGAPGTGRHLAVMRTVERCARERAAPRDWCYACNFDQPGEPRALSLPAGMGQRFAEDVDALVQSARRALRQAVLTEDYAEKRRAIVRELEAQRDQVLAAVQQQALALGFAIRETENGLGIIPVTRATPRRSASPSNSTSFLGGQPPAEPSQQAEAGEDGGGDYVPMSREQVSQLSPEERQRLEANEAQVTDLVERTLIPQVRRAQEAARARLRALDREVAERTLSTVGEDTIARYAQVDDASAFFRRLRADMVARASELRGDNGGGGRADGGDEDAQEDATSDEDETDAADETPAELEEERDEDPRVRFFLRRYKINVITAHQPDDHAPVVVEMHPSRANLLGRIEVGAVGGLPYADHLSLKPGALHRANGGYLILHARDLISEPHGWETLKRTLRFGTIQTDINADGSEGPRSASLRPQPIESEIRVVLIGSRKIYAGLAEVDPEFLQQFKVRADFDTEMPRTPENEQAYARFAGKVARDSGSPPLTADAVARVILQGSRWVDDQERLSTQFSAVHDLTTEACYWARKEQAPQTTATHVVRAVKQRLRRVSLPAERALYEQRENGQILLDTDGQVVGQINGLSVVETVDGDYGAPTRITARVSPGLAGVLNLERESEMSGPIHDKGVFALTGFLTGRFATEAPLGLSASITFEQEYGGVEGDSASSAELYALLSCLSGVPLRQWLAVTGAINQRGQVQVIGGANEKIEGFFRLCQFRGLTGRQGVLIPRGNLRNLVLRDEVVEAVRAGQFHIYAVSHVDEGIELLTGVPAGLPDQEGRYIPGTINARVTQTLQAFNERVRAFGLTPALVPQFVR